MQVAERWSGRFAAHGFESEKLPQVKEYEEAQREHKKEVKQQKNEKPIVGEQSGSSLLGRRSRVVFSSKKSHIYSIPKQRKYTYL